MMGQQDERYSAAVQTFMLEPEALTKEQIDALATADEALGRRATDKRAAALTAAAQGRHLAAFGQKATKPDLMESLGGQTADAILLALVEPRQRLKALEADRDTWAERYRALESRILELEAQRADVTHD